MLKWNPASYDTCWEMLQNNPQPESDLVSWRLLTSIDDDLPLLLPEYIRVNMMFYKHSDISRTIRLNQFSLTWDQKVMTVPFDPNSIAILESLVDILPGLHHFTYVYVDNSRPRFGSNVFYCKWNENMYYGYDTGQQQIIATNTKGMMEFCKLYCYMCTISQLLNGCLCQDVGTLVVSYLHFSQDE